MENFPIIKFEISGMKHTILVALSEYASKMDDDIKLAIEQSISPEEIKRVLSEEAKRAIEDTLKQEVRRFFTCTGEGAEFIREAVSSRLRKNLVRQVG